MVNVGDGSFEKWLARVAWAKGVGLLVAIAAISSLHYTTSPSHVVAHEIYRHLYYLPIIVGAYWYGVWGGLLTALATSLAYVPHIRDAWAPNVPYTVNQYAELVVFHLIGLSVGLLASFQRKLTERYRNAAASLERANRELRDSHEQLRRADKLSALGRIAAGLAHEIRNPLAGVKGALEIIGGRAQAGSPDAEFAAIAQRELNRIDGMVTQFLTYARPRQPERSETDLHELFKHVAALLRPQAERAGATMEIEALQLPAVWLDPQLIEQVLFNVVMNAVEVSPRGGRVRIRCGLEPEAIVIDIVDEGPGISTEIANHIFEPFFTTKEGGTGLGLAISHRIITAHGGTIEALPGSGSGTDVRIRLPLSSAAREGGLPRVATTPV